MSDKFYSDETLLTSHKTLFLSLLAMSIKLIIFNIIKPSRKFFIKTKYALNTSRPYYLFASCHLEYLFPTSLQYSLILLLQ